MTLRFTLVSDGSSDRALLPILRWLIVERFQVPYAIELQWADLTRLHRKVSSLRERLVLSMRLYPCDLLFVHRDAEKATRETRSVEITRALRRAGVEVPAVCVVPVRMLEAWLLFDQSALRRAAGNPQGTMTLRLPSLKRIESVPDPKGILRDALREASGLRGRKLRRLSVAERAFRITQLIEEYSPLLELPAFSAFEAELRQALRDNRWLE